MIGAGRFLCALVLTMLVLSCLAIEPLCLRLLLCSQEFFGAFGFGGLLRVFVVVFGGVFGVCLFRFSRLQLSPLLHC